MFAELSIRPELAIDVGDDDALLCDGMGSGNKSERSDTTTDEDISEPLDDSK